MGTARPARKAYLLAAGVPLLLLLLIHPIVDQRHAAGGSRWLALSPDTHQYLRMIGGESADPPFANRLLVPFLAARLPLPPLQALRLLTYLSVFAGYVILCSSLIGRLRVCAGAACLAIVAVMTCTRGLLLVQNPFLTDGLGFLAMAVMLACFLADWPAAFGLAAVTGVLSREDSLFGAFGYLAGRRRWAAAGVAGAALATYLVLHAPSWGTSQGLLEPRRLGHWAFYAKAYFAFGFVWPLALLGLWRARASELGRIIPYFACTLAGAALSTLLAADVTRVFLPVLPGAAVGCALAFERLAPRGAMLAAWLAVLVANVGLALPNRLFPGAAEHTRELEGWYERLALPIVLHQIAGLLLVALAARLLLHSRGERSGV